MKDSKAKAGAAIAKGGKPRNDDKNVKKKLSSVKDAKVSKKQRRNKPKTKKDPNQPKRPPTAFFLFLDDFRKTYKENHPNAKGVAVVGKAGGDKWKEMSDADKAPFVRKAAQKKTEYEKAMTAYKQKNFGKVEDEGSVEESDKSKSEIHDDESEEEEEEDEDE